MRKHQLGLAVAATAAALAFGPIRAQSPPEVEAQLDALFAELAGAGESDWRRIEAEILRVWSRSGSEAMDLLLRRGQEAMEAEDLAAAVEHLTALTDHAPDFAEGWNARATAFYLMGEYTLSIADIERVLRLNPRHFGALSGLAIMLEDLGEIRRALEAQRAAQALHPHRPEVSQAIERLQTKLGGYAL